MIYLIELEVKTAPTVEEDSAFLQSVHFNISLGYIRVLES